MDDLDYKDLFRDAIHTIAYIARAAGFDPNDPTVEPPAIVARIENLQTELRWHEDTSGTRAEQEAAMARDEAYETEMANARAALTDEQIDAEMMAVGLDPALVRREAEVSSRLIVRSLRSAAEVQRLTAERAALLAPVEGVDVEEVLRLDREGTAGPWRTIPMDCGDYWGVEIVGPDGQPITGETRISAADRDVVERYRTAAPALAREVASLRDHLNTARRLLPPRYVAADGSILDPQRCTPHARDCAECGRGRAHDEECLGVLETPAEEVARLRAELEGARLTLAAEQGRAEGAPSEGWVWAGDERGVWGWRKGGVCIIRYGNGDWGFEMDGRHIFAPNARAAMLAADAATEAR